MIELNSYLDLVSEKSKFPCSLGILGGFINLKNSSKGGSQKEFTLSLESILSGLEDIRGNLDKFSLLTNYEEKSWRDSGSNYFTDLVLNSMITVQTKPCFTTFSKIIAWATDADCSNYHDGFIDLSESSLDETINKVKSLALSFSPTIMYSPKTIDKPLILTDNQGKFAYELISFLIKNKVEQPFFDCIVEKNGDFGNVNIELEGFRLTTIFKKSNSRLSPETLMSGSKPRFFLIPFKVGKQLYYLSTEWTYDKGSRLDIKTLQNIFNYIYPQYEIKEQQGVYSLCHTNIKTTPLPKPFILLAGISGTGKTRFVREQAKATGSLDETYCLTSVRPDWHEPSDLLGYLSRLSSHGNAEYITTDVLQFIAKAWRCIVEKGNVNLDSSERLVVSGSHNDLNSIQPYWLCLDEMNLAPVEQYFADYLSVSETREWAWDNDSFTYSCDPILKPTIIKELSPESMLKLRKDLGFYDDSYDYLWGKICEFGLPIPFNLIVAGTVNIDETTHGFSRKVIDRALSFDFGEFFPNDYDEFFKPTIFNKSLSYPIISQAKMDDMSDTYDKDAAKTIRFLTSINEVLKKSPFELAYRALNELLVSVACVKPQNKIDLQAVWDDFLMCKVLPRIEGDSDKLRSHTNNTDDKNILELLEDKLASELSAIWGSDIDNSNNQRPDLYRSKNSAEGVSTDNKIPCRSKAKIQWMKQRLEIATFTSFWP